VERWEVEIMWDARSYCGHSTWLELVSGIFQSLAKNSSHSSPRLTWPFAAHTLSCVKLTVSNTWGIFCRDNSICASYLMSKLVSLDDRVAPLLMGVKCWARHQCLTSDSTGAALSNFTLNHLVIYFLQYMHILPPTNELCHQPGLFKLFLYRLINWLCFLVDLTARGMLQKAHSFGKYPTNVTRLHLVCSTPMPCSERCLIKNSPAFL